MTREQIRALSNDELNYELQTALGDKSIYRIDYCGDYTELQYAESILSPDQWARYLRLNMDNVEHMIYDIREEIRNLLLPRVTTDFLCWLWHGMTLKPRVRAELLLFVLTEQPL